METRSGRIDFPGHVGAHTIPLRLVFERPVLSAEVALAGYEAHYAGEDHHVRRIQAELGVEPGGREDEGWSARIVATLNLQDDSGASHSGWIDYLLFVELGKDPRDPLGPIGPIGDPPVFEG